MENEALNKQLELDQDELVLWSGKPAPFEIMDQYYKPALIRNYIIAIAVGAVVFIAGFILNASAGDVNLVGLAVICCFPLVIIPAGQSQYSNYGKKCQYFFTNKNIIVSWESRLLKLPVNEIRKFDSVPQSEGTVSVRFGKAAGIPVRKNRDYALKCLNANEDAEQNKACLMYNLTEKDAAIVLDLIDKYRVVA